jgi:hypothetical protein
VNYPFAKDKWASGFVDLPIGNASTCFCLVSDSVPEPDNMFSYNVYIKLFFGLIAYIPSAKDRWVLRSVR